VGCTEGRLFHFKERSKGCDPKCTEKGELCVRGKCRQVWTDPAEVKGLPKSLPESCFASWPNQTSCAEWSVNETAGIRMLESNSVPPFDVEPYCPFGLGQGYCESPAFGGNSTDCDVFAGMTCPCDPDTLDACPSNTPDYGDVIVPSYQYFEFPLYPDPTSREAPIHMYNNSALKTGNTYQVIGAHLTGVQLKGPAEANGYNVDTCLIPLFCGGHVTPPVGEGPIYHFHKAADCLDNIAAQGAHGPLVGYAADGFQIFGFGDHYGEPVLDECNGHFGVDAFGNVTYHYHATAVHNRGGTMAFQPYYLGCLGPSLSRCNQTISDDYDSGADWCGPGCGADVCVQPSTPKEDLLAYLESFPSGQNWLDKYTINNYEIHTTLNHRHHHSGPHISKFFDQVAH